MRKLTKSLLATLMLFSMTAGLVSCSDDDEPKKEPAREIAGTYEGYSEASSAYFTGQISEGDNVVITAVDSEHAKIVYTSTEFGTVTIESATVTGDGTYTFSGSGTTSMGHAGSVKDYDCTATGVVSNGSVEMEVVVPAVMGGFTLDFHTGAQ